MVFNYGRLYDIIYIGLYWWLPPKELLTIEAANVPVTGIAPENAVENRAFATDSEISRAAKGEDGGTERRLVILGRHGSKFAILHNLNPVCRRHAD